MKNLSTLLRETKEENWTRINQWLLRKVVDEKPPDPGGVLGGKPTPYDWGLKGRESWHFEGSFDEDWLEVMYSHV